MIKEFNNVETRESAVIYTSTFEQIKKLYAKSPEQAGELAISAMELALTGQISSDDFIIDLILENMKVINKKNEDRYNKKVENKKQQRIIDLKLAEVAKLHTEGLKQREIAERLGMKQQDISYRLSIIRNDYPELIFTKNTENTKKTTNDNVNDNDNDNVNDNKGMNCAYAQIIEGGSCASAQSTENFIF